VYVPVVFSECKNVGKESKKENNTNLLEALRDVRGV
jgi:hypothetical protein